MVGTVSEEKNDPNLTKIRGLYTIFDAEEAEWQARKQRLNNLSSLSLFNQQESESTESISARPTYDGGRPITPINESVKASPKTYAGLSKLIHRRINPRPEWTHISEEDQSSLGAVIMGEVNAVWPLLRRQVADPFLTHQQNKELQRRITVHCVTVCEKLFMHFAGKVKTLNSRGIFTGPANMSRIRAQLALDAGQYLNILSVRRHIISDLKKPPSAERITFSREEASGTPATPMPVQSPTDLSFRKLVKSSRPKQKMKYQFNLKAEIKSMQSLMPTLSLTKIQQLEPLTDRSNAIFQDVGETEYEDLSREFDEEEQGKDIDSPSQRRRRYPSEPTVPHTLLLEELLLRQREDDEDFLAMRSPSQAVLSRQRLQSVKTTWSRNESRVKCHSSLGLPRVPPSEASLLEAKDPKADLKLLVAKRDKERQKEKEAQYHETGDAPYDMPPLIQAITRREAQNENLRQLVQKQKDLDAKAEEEMREKMQPLPLPQYPQPPIVQSKLPGASNPVNKRPITIRASDVKINDRVDLSSVTLRSYLPVYNDLTGDISQATVKELDANLFQGGELREVYSEIMKTVPNIHQHYDNDPLIVTPGTNVDLSAILASSTLVRPRSQQVINPKLQRDELDMPWEGQQVMWSKGAHMQSGYPASDASSIQQGQGEAYVAFHRFTPSQLNHSGVQKGSRAYASWLQWWKNTINSDDFFKYLSTQDTDFLSVLFHFYDSDAADSESDSMRTAKLEAQRERDRKLSELKKEKEEFTPGLWNVKAVMLGGLGKDPEIEEEEEEFSDFGTPRSLDGQSLSQWGSKSLGGTPRHSQTRPKKSRVKSRQKLLSRPATQRSKLSKQDILGKFNKDYPLRVAPQHVSPLASSSSTSYEGTDSTESASFTFPGKKFGVDDSDSSTSSFHGTNTDESSSSKDYSDESFLAELEQLERPVYTSQADSDTDSTLTPSCGLFPVRKVLRKAKGSNKQLKQHHSFGTSSLKARSLKLHNKLTADDHETRSGTTTSTIGSLPDVRKNTRKVVKKNAAESNKSHKIDEDSGLEKSPEELLSGSTGGEESTSGYMSTNNALKNPQNYGSGEENSKFRDNRNEQHEKLQSSDETQQNSVEGSETRQAVRYRRRKSIFRVENPVDTASFLEKLDPCARIAKIAAEGINWAKNSIQRGTTSSAKTHTNASTVRSSKRDSTRHPTIQDRLEVVWHKLRMPDAQKLNCALKYSTDKYIKRLPDIVSSWERITDLIIQREKLMTSLESFEKGASDPNRFFERGYRGSSVARLSEAKTRATLYKKLENIEITLKAALISLKTRFSDTVTYNGRPYLEKMDWDKIEMLYYLQQERRCIMLKEHGHSQPLDSFLSYGQMRATTILPPSSRRFTQIPLNSVKIAVPE